MPLKSVAKTNARSYPSTETVTVLGPGRPTNRRFLATRMTSLASGAMTVWNVPSLRLVGSRPGTNSGRMSSRAVAGLPRNASLALASRASRTERANPFPVDVTCGVAER